MNVSRLICFLMFCGGVHCAPHPPIGAASTETRAPTESARQPFVDNVTFEITFPPCAKNERTPVPTRRMATHSVDALTQAGIGEVVVHMSAEEHSHHLMRLRVAGRDTTYATDSLSQIIWRGPPMTAQAEVMSIGFFRVPFSVQRRLGFSDTVVVPLRRFFLER